MKISRWIAPFALLALVSACVGPPRAVPKVVAKPNFIPAPPRPITAPQPVRPALDPRVTPPPALVTGLRSLAQGFDGTVGIAVTRIDGSWTFEHNGNQLFPQQSVSKLWVALAVMNAVDGGRIKLDQNVRVGPEDLTLFHQPIAQLVRKDGYTTTVADLLRRAMTASDNSANDRLATLVGGPEKIRAVLAEKGITGIRFGPGERLLQAGTAGMKWRQEYSIGRAFYTARALVPVAEREAALDKYLANPVDGARPDAIVATLAKLQRGALLSASSTRHLLSLMNEATTGKQRILGGVPYDWQYGHKTGTGQSLNGRETGYNDVGIMTAPDGSSYAVAVMIAQTRRAVPVRQALMQGVAALIAANHQK
jgi:beta-lactamase class A